MDEPVDVLLIEDDDRDAELILHAFRKQGSSRTIRVARDGPEALNWLFPTTAAGSTPPARPRCILLDLKLPKVDGLEVLQRIKSDARTRPIPVIILTSSKVASDLEAAYAAGANSYLCKPVDYSALADVIKRWADYWLLLNESLP